MEVATDITQVKELQDRLTVIGRAVAGMAHRVKNILMGLEGGMFVVGTALRSGDQVTLDRGWEMIERNVDRVSHVVKDLLYCSKKRDAELRDAVIVEDIAREVWELFRERAAADGIDLRLEVGADHPRRVDPDGMHSLVTNLVANAIDACRFDPDESKERHAIELRVDSGEDRELVVEVSDDGAGISSEDAERVFEDFFSTKGTEGTGLGLLIINRVVEQHTGSIDFHTRPGEGTRFVVRIPWDVPEPADGRAAESRRGESAQTALDPRHG
jgi:signal transduction histidine kinase